MKKIYVLALALSLIFGCSLVAMADTGFQVGFGYEKTENDLTVQIPGVSVDINRPGDMYFVELNYQPTDLFSLSAKYDWGSTDLAQVDIAGGLLGLGIEQENTILKVEGALHWQVTDKLDLSGLVGYARYNTTDKIELDILFNSFQGQLEQTISGAYVGLAADYAVNDRFRIGGAYRWIADPDAKWQLGNGPSIDLEDPTVNDLELYARYAINKSWNLKAGYSQTWTEYSLGILDVSNTSSGLSVAVEYKF